MSQKTKVGLYINMKIWAQFKSIVSYLKIKNKEFKDKDYSDIVEDLLKQFIEKHKHVLNEVVG